MLMLQISERVDPPDTYLCPTYGLMPEQIGHAAIIAATPGIVGICSLLDLLTKEREPKSGGYGIPRNLVFPIDVPVRRYPRRWADC